MNDHLIQPCLYCGGIMNLRNHQDARFWLMCQNCSATSPSVESEERVIRLHNQTVQSIENLQAIVRQMYSEPADALLTPALPPSMPDITTPPKRPIRRPLKMSEEASCFRSICYYCDQASNDLYVLPDGMFARLCKTCAEKHGAILAD